MIVKILWDQFRRTHQYNYRREKGYKGYNRHILCAYPQTLILPSLFHEKHRNYLSGLKHPIRNKIYQNKASDLFITKTVQEHLP